jgi:hypothetical protein
LIVYRICQTDDYKRLATSINVEELQGQPSNQKDVAQIEVFKIYDVADPKTGNIVC